MVRDRFLTPLQHRDFLSLVKMSKSTVVSLACAVLIAAQSSIPSFTVSLAPAAETVASTSTPANVPLFDIETVQLTDDIVTELQTNPEVSEYASLFDFGDANSTKTASATSARSAQRCRTMPGDALYPSKIVWTLFDLLSGGALEPIVPIGSVCYPHSTYNNYDAKRCAYLVENLYAEEP